MKKIRFTLRNIDKTNTFAVYYLLAQQYYHKLRLPMLSSLLFLQNFYLSYPQQLLYVPKVRVHYKGRHAMLQKYMILEIPVSRLFLGADAQLLGTSLAGANISLSICLKSLHKQNIPSLYSEWC